MANLLAKCYKKKQRKIRAKYQNLFKEEKEEKWQYIVANDIKTFPNIKNKG